MHLSANNACLLHLNFQWFPLLTRGFWLFCLSLLLLVRWSRYSPYTVCGVCTQLMGGVLVYKCEQQLNRPIFLVIAPGYAGSPEDVRRPFMIAVARFFNRLSPFLQGAPCHGKSWNLGRPFSRPGQSWKIAKVVEKSWKMMIMLWNFYYCTEQFCKNDTSFIKSNYEPFYLFNNATTSRWNCHY